jgi:hypothetical protein
MGDCMLLDIEKGEDTAARQLKKEGYLVPTWNDDLYDVDHFQELTHFDDVQWARDAKGKLIIYRFVKLLDRPDAPDAIIHLRQQHDAAVKALKSRIHYKKTMEDAPITLKGYGVVTPILTNAAQIALRQRQLTV